MTNGSGRLGLRYEISSQDAIEAALLKALKDIDSLEFDTSTPANISLRCEGRLKSYIRTFRLKDWKKRKVTFDNFHIIVGEIRGHIIDKLNEVSVRRSEILKTMSGFGGLEELNE